MESKSSILSKREKITGKRASRVEIQVISSDQAPLAPQYNIFDLAKLTKIPLHPEQPPLAYAEDLKEINEVTNQPDRRQLFTYSIHNSNAVRYVSSIYLNNRFNEISNELKNKVNAPEEADAREDERKERIGGNSRYFNVAGGEEEEEMVKCFRCGARGHISKNCLEQKKKARCMYCLGQHEHFECTARSCFKCNGLGHVSQECKVTGPTCRKCSNLGHLQRDCGVITFLDYHNSSQKQIQTRYATNDLQRLKCLSNCTEPQGHFNCYTYSRSRLQPYQNRNAARKR